MAMLTELFPAELHDYRGKAEGRAMGMPLDQFTDEAYQALASGKDQLVIGGLGPVTKGFYELLEKKNEVFTGLTKMILGPP